MKKNNLQLIAQQYNIDASKAQIIQAKIWQQPIVSGELNFYNPEKEKFLMQEQRGKKHLQSSN
ncbi:hypothetical protein JJC03_01690 [Flavobacterium oreochromis]|uniref:hypothetical protein n=1 Tax=Flavobacterium oreochromis TaxID=2906078 RepID=UPI001CE6C1F5|nr:hypothetical protein [Flavobacterium oreochromis]QYS86774.1 hypothetical protein JJC03_01690 [Flavobacterium oreochromis]